MINVGIIGAGFIGTIHARAYAKLSDVKIAYINDLSLEKANTLAKEVGGRPSTNPDDVFQDRGVDLIDVCVPTPFHARFAVCGLEAGKHVVVEKPLSLTLEDADQILSAARHSGMLLMVAHVLRFWPEYKAIREYIHSQRSGLPVFASAQRLSNFPQWATWFQDPQQSGGVLLDLSIHDLDMMNWLFGRPKSIYTRGAVNKDGLLSYAIIQLDYDSVFALVESTFSMPMNYPFTAGMRVMFENGMLEYLFRAGGASLEQGNLSHYLVLHEPGKPNQPLPFEKEDPFENEIAYFIDCVRAKRSPELVTSQQARLALQTSLLARQSFEQGCPIAFPSE